MSGLRIFHRRPVGVDHAPTPEIAACSERARKDAITIAAQGRAIRDLRDQVAELRAQLAATVEAKR